MEIAGFENSEFEGSGIRHRVFCRGEGRGVLLMHELPGMTDSCIRLARRISDAGFYVAMPLLFGRPGQRAMIRNLVRVCVQRQFRLLAERRSSPISDWLRALSLDLWQKRGGPGVGVIGMCLTGNFAIGLMADEHVLAPVSSQPSLPFTLNAAKRRALALAPDELERVKDRAQGGQKLIGLRFTGDAICPAERFESLRRELGTAFEGIEIDSAPGNRHGIASKAHSVLTDDLIDREGHPTRAALDRTLAFLAEGLNA
ncbi:MAG: dienelactone hydrolase family protein [Acidobacteriota bacterium]